MALATSWNGLAFIAREEAIILTSYPDGEYYSIGAGHNGPDVKPGDTITLDAAIALLRSDLAAREAMINTALNGQVQQHEFDALVSLAYNRGSVVLDVVRLINALDADEAMDRLLACCRNSLGDFMLGLAYRRAREADLFLNGKYGDLSTVPLMQVKGGPITHVSFPKEVA